MKQWKEKLNAILLCTAMAAGLAGTAGISTVHAEEPTETTVSDPTYFNAAQTPAADPFVLYDDATGYYYAYSTDGANKGYFYGVYRSPDLAVWEKAADGAIKSDEKNRWGKTWFWAPEVYYNSDTGKYFMFYAAMMKDDQVAANFEYADFAEACKVGVAVSDRPEGPFESIADHPIEYYPYDPEYHDVNLLMDEKQMLPPSTLEEGESAPLGVYIPFIDPNVFFDEDGSIYLYYSRNAYRNWVWDTDLDKYVEESNIYAVKLKNDWWNDPEGKTMPEIDDEYVNATKPADDTSAMRKDGFVPVISYSAQKQDWENAHVNDYVKYNGAKKNRRWAEGSTTFRVDTDTDGDGIKERVYYMLYSCNNYENENYGVGYATASSPLGPWTKAENNPILQQDPDKSIYSTGHGSIIHSPDGTELFYVYHGRNSTTSGRRMYADRLIIDSNKKDKAGIPELSIMESTNDQPAASGVGPFKISGPRDSIILDLSETRTLTYQVTSMEGAAFDLSNPLNRMRAAAADDRIIEADCSKDKVTLIPVQTGNTKVELIYERLSSDGTWKTAARKEISIEVRNWKTPTETDSIHRLYNPNSGEHFFTGDLDEHSDLIECGWKSEGIGWIAPVSSEYPVYRLYNSNAGDHHFTLSEEERDTLIKAGWKDEGIAFYSAAPAGKPVYRAYNPNAKSGAHHFTISADEQANLIEHGWKDEGISWYSTVLNSELRNIKEVS